MKVYKSSEVRRNFASVLNEATHEDVKIRRKDGTIFILALCPPVAASPFADVRSVSCEATMDDILQAVRESRSG